MKLINRDQKGNFKIKYTIHGSKATLSCLSKT